MEENTSCCEGIWDFWLCRDMNASLHFDNDEALEQVAQRSCGFPIPESIQGLMEGPLLLWQGFWNEMIFKVPSNSNYSMIL